MTLKPLALEIAEDHVHLFVSFPPRLSISEVAGKMKAISAKVTFGEFPEAEREMYGGRAQGRTDTLLERSGMRSQRK